MTARLAVFVLSTAAAFAAAQSGTTTKGSTAQITPTIRAQIRKAKVRVVVPTYVPAGFRLRSGGVAAAKQMELRDFTLRYEKPGTKAYFVIQMASDGLGDPLFDLPNGEVLEPTGTLAGKSALFGAYNLDFVKRKGVLLWHTTWYELPGKTYPRYAMVMGSDLPPETGKKIVDGLRWLTP